MGTDVTGLSGKVDFSDCLNSRGAAHSCVCFGDSHCFYGSASGDVPIDDEPFLKYSSFEHGMMDHCHELEDSLIHAVGDFRELAGWNTLDLLEICAPWDSPLTKAVIQEGGRAMSIGLHNGYDLKTVAGFKAALALLRKTKPRYIHVSPPCDPWTAIQNCNQKTEAQKISLAQKRQESRKLMKHCQRLVEVQVCELNGECGWTPENPEFHHAGGEHPLHAQSWKEPEMKQMVRLCGGRFSVHGCRHGMVSRKTGLLVKKPWGWFSTHKGGSFRS